MNKWDVKELLCIIFLMRYYIFIDKSSRVGIFDNQTTAIRHLSYIYSTGVNMNLPLIILLWSLAGYSAYAGSFGDPDPLFQQARELHFSAQYDRALSTYRLAADRYAQEKSHWPFIRAKLASAQICHQLERPAESRDYARQAIQASRKHFGEQSVEFAACRIRLIHSGFYNNASGENIFTMVEQAYQTLITTDASFDEDLALACILRSGLSRPEDKTKWLHQALELRKSVFGSCHPLVANVWLELAALNYYRGHYQQQLSDARRALDILRVCVAEPHDRYGKAYADIAYCYGKMGYYEEQMKYYRKSLANYVPVLGESHSKTVFVYSDIGNCYGFKGDFDQQIAYNQKALDMALRKDSKVSRKDLAFFYKSLGEAYAAKGDYEKSLDYNERSLEIRRIVFGEYSQEVANNYHNIGWSLGKKGEYHKALGFFRKALDITNTTQGPGHPDLGKRYNSLGWCYGKTGDLPEQFKYLKLALKNHIRHLGSQHPEVASTYSQLAAGFEKISEHERQLQYYQKALAIQLHSLGPSHPDVASSYRHIGRTFGQMGKRDEEEIHYLKSLNLLLSAKTSAYPDLARSYISVGKHYQQRGFLEKALTHYQKAIMVLCSDFDDPDIYQLPELSGGFAKTILLEALTRKAGAWLEWFVRDEPAVPEGIAALETYQLAAKLLDRLRISLTSEDAKLNLSTNYMSIYEEGVRAAVLLYNRTGNRQYCQEAFALAEKGKAFLLLQAMMDKEARQFAGIPDTLIAADKHHKINLRFYERQLHQVIRNNDSLATNHFREVLFRETRAFDRLRTMLEKSYPEYYRLKYERPVTSVDRLQKEILQDKPVALIEYFKSDSTLYIFRVTREELMVHTVPVDAPFNKTLHTLHRSLIQPNVTQEPEFAYREFSNAAYEVYRTILEPVLIPGKWQHLIIIPDDILGRIPFEVLLSREPPHKPDFTTANLQYLLEDYTISYAWSATLLENNTQPALAAQGNQSVGMAGFAPSFSPGFLALSHCSSEGLPVLACSEKEVSQAARLMAGKVYIGHDASKHNFIQASGENNVLHLATHACVDDLFPMNNRIFFEDEPVTTADLFGMNINAEMVVLSACNSGTGNYIRGEGMMSLSRGFAYAGCQSLVMSLWAVDDCATAAIMENFYREIAQGHDKALSLRKAKLNYIRQYGKPTSHPYYWAAFVQSGNPDPIAVAGRPVNFHLWMWAIVLIIGIIILLWYRAS